MSVVLLDTNAGFKNQSGSRLSLSSISSYPSTLNMVSNEIYLNTISSLNDVLTNVELQMNQFNFSQSKESVPDTPPVLTLDLDKEIDHQNSLKPGFTKNVNFENIESTEPEASPDQTVQKIHSNKVIRHLLRLIRPSINKKRNKKIHHNKKSSSIKIGNKKNTVGRSKFRSNRTVGVLNNEEFRLRKNESFARNNKKSKKSSFSSTNSSNKQSKTNTNTNSNRARRALSLITKRALDLLRMNIDFY